MQEISKDIFRIVIPFEDIYTSVFVVKTQQGAVLMDTATYASDVDGYILPALEALGVSRDQLKYVMISHSHRDHAGGLARLLEIWPELKVLSRSEALCGKHSDSSIRMPADGEKLLDVLQVVAIPGHSADCAGLLDLRTGTLLTGDCLQAFGIYGCGRWGANISLPAQHRAALERLRALKIGCIVAAHDYHPCGYMAVGEEEVARYIGQCEAALDCIAGLIRRNPGMDDAEIAELYSSELGYPTLGAYVVAALRRELGG